jgi:hypothetical protein
MSKATKRQFLVTISGFPGTWSTSSGGSLSADVTRDYDGGSDVPDLLGGVPTAEDLEISRTFDPVRDLAILEKLRREVGRGRYTIMKQATDANYNKVGKPMTYSDCLLLGVNDPHSDASSSDTSQMTVKFATTGAV